jgi:hypothetical protein
MTFDTLEIGMAQIVSVCLRWYDAPASLPQIILRCSCDLWYNVLSNIGGVAVTKSEILNNQRAFDHAIAQQRLEGLTVPPEALADLQRIARGEMTTADALRAAHARFAHDQVFQ